jgi:hypothetical protein
MFRLFFSTVFFWFTIGQLTYPLSPPRERIASATAGDYAVFGGGSRVDTHVVVNTIDIFNFKTIEWTSSQLNYARSSFAAIGLNNFVYFAGGRNGEIFYNSVEVFDVQMQKITHLHNLTEGRDGLAAGKVKDIVLFAGGTLQNRTRTSRVDIFNQTSEIWSTAELSVARSRISSTSTPRFILFSGGRNSSTSPIEYYSVVDVFDSINDTFIQPPIILPEARSRMGTAFYSFNNTELLFFAGGEASYGKSKRVDVLNATSLQYLYSFNLSVGRDGLAVVQLDSLMLFAGGADSTPSGTDIVDVFDPLSRTLKTQWKLSSPRSVLTGLVETVQDGSDNIDLVLLTGGKSVDAFQLCQRDSQCGYVIYESICEGVGICHSTDSYCIPALNVCSLSEALSEATFELDSKQNVIIGLSAGLCGGIILALLVGGLIGFWFGKKTKTTVGEKSSLVDNR